MKDSKTKQAVKLPDAKFLPSISRAFLDALFSCDNRLALSAGMYIARRLLNPNDRVALILVDMAKYLRANRGNISKCLQDMKDANIICVEKHNHQLYVTIHPSLLPVKNKNLSNNEGVAKPEGHTTTQLDAVAVSEQPKEDDLVTTAVKVIKWLDSYLRDSDRNLHLSSSFRRGTEAESLRHLQECLDSRDVTWRECMRTWVVLDQCPEIRCGRTGKPYAMNYTTYCTYFEDGLRKYREILSERKKEMEYMGFAV